MSRNNSSSNLRKDSSTPSLVEFPSLRDRDSTTSTPSSSTVTGASNTPNLPSRNGSPANLLQPKNRRVSSAREAARESSPARNLSSTSLSRLATSVASQSSPAVTQTTTANQPTTQPSQESQSQDQTQSIKDSVQPLSPRPQRPINPNVPHWPTSPRLSLSRSPPPMVRSPSITSPRKSVEPRDMTLPPQMSVVKGRESPGKGYSGDEPRDGQQSYFQHLPAQRPPRTIGSPAPGLETVTESSLPSTPAIGMSQTMSTDSIASRLTQAEERRAKQQAKDAETKARQSESSISSRTTHESESDTGNQSDRKPPSRAPSRALSRRPTVSASSSKAAQDGTGDMRAEIETVVSVPQQINPGSVRLTKKPSQETIRPAKKEKRRPKRAPTGPNAREYIYA